MSFVGMLRTAVLVLSASAALVTACTPRAHELIPDPDPIQSVPPPEAAGTTLRVEVTGIQGQAGLVRLAVYQGSDGFPAEHERAFLTRVLPASDSRLEASFSEMPAGTYAVAVIHDSNDNGELDKNWVGMPTEGYGVSNDPPARLGPPRFDDARFSWPTPKATVTVRLRYP